MHSQMQDDWVYCAFYMAETFDFNSLLVGILIFNYLDNVSTFLNICEETADFLALTSKFTESPQGFGSWLLRVSA